MPHRHGADSRELGDILGPDCARPTHEPVVDGKLVGARRLDLFPII